MQWDREEAEGKLVITPAEGYKWNKLGGLYESFYDKYDSFSLDELVNAYKAKVDAFIEWLNSLSEKDVFVAGSREWASSTPANWPVWKWVHINTVAPFKYFRSKIRKWKKAPLNG